MIKMRTFISIVLGLVVFTSIPSFASAASLYLSPATGVFSVGATFRVDVLLDTEGSAVNAAEGTLSFNAGQVKVLSVTNTNSIFNLWAVEPTFDNGGGTITFGGGSPKGYTGSAGKVVTITFQALRESTSKVSFTAGAALAADGQGTNVIASMREGAYTIRARNEVQNPEYVAPDNTPSAPAVTSSTHPDRDGWYPLTSAKLSWTLPEGVTELRTLLDSKSGTIPTINYRTPFTEKMIDDLPEGVSYFHLQAKNKAGWGRVAHVRLGVDTQKPERFTLALEERTADNSSFAIRIDSFDAGSGIGKYEFVIDDREPVIHVEDGKKRFVLPALLPGRHTIVAKAFDRAGNYLVDSLSIVIPALDAPRFTDYPSVVTTGTIIVAKGESFADARVLVSLRRGSDVLATTTILADGTGAFTYVAPQKVSAGVYTLSAIAQDTYGGVSEPSVSVTIASNDSGIVRIGSIALSVMSVVVPLVALALLLLFMLLYGRYRVALMRHQLQKEVGEAETAVKNAFIALHKEATRNVSLLEKVGERRTLTSDEKEVLASLKGHLDTIEDRVMKELRDVERLLDGK
jgi:hypothetical protein